MMEHMNNRGVRVLALFNFIFVAGLVILFYVVSGRVIEKWKNRLNIESAAGYALQDDIDDLSPRLSEFPEEVLDTLLVLSRLRLSKRDPVLTDVFEASLIAEKQHPSDEGQTSFLSQEDRQSLISASGHLLTILAVRNPKRWRSYAQDYEKDEAIGLRALSQTARMTEAGASVTPTNPAGWKGLVEKGGAS